MSENENNIELSGDKWLEDFLAAKAAEEISVDELAVASAGLVHPDDVELERIIKEVSSEDWSAEPEQEAPAEPAPQPVPPPLPAPEPEIFKDDEFRDTFGEGRELEQVFQDESLPEEPTQTPEQEIEEEAPVEKGRPKKKRAYRLFGLPHLAVTAIWLAIIVFIGVSVGRLVWLCASDVLAFGRTPITATVSIEENESIDSIADKLRDAGLIRYPGLFKVYINITDSISEIKPGTYNFKSVADDGETIVYDYMALRTVISPKGNALVVVEDLRIPEGYTCAQIFKLLEEKKVCTVKELEEYAANGDLGEYWFLNGVTRGDKYCLEGYLFPDTYDFYENDNPRRVLRKLLNAFDAAFTDKMKDDLAVLNERLEDMMRKNGYGSDYIAANRYTLKEVVIVASMIEKESANNAESFTVSSVIYNRLTNASKYPFLNIDASVVYALGGKQDLTKDDLNVDHPYNTYKYKGLTPGPIANPSQNSLAAALDPESTELYYYAYNPATNRHEFFETYEEHLEFLDSLKEAA